MEEGRSTEWPHTSKQIKIEDKYVVRKEDRGIQYVSRAQFSEVLVDQNIHSDKLIPQNQTDGKHPEIGLNFTSNETCSGSLSKREMEIGVSVNLPSNGLDSKANKIKKIVEDSISADSKQTVIQILDQVNQLSTAEKLLLYLKLPSGNSTNVDPLRQPLNPLGSRFEIHQTITWIRTHLEEDPDVSLPKQDVYDEYIAYCGSNTMKPLSTADFGKVMKQVFPRVRPRRLGTRGNSRYCYAGMRKRMKLDAPLLPDLGQDSKSTHCSDDEMLTAASFLIREWAEKLLGVRFNNLQDLACHLVEKMCVDSRSVAAFTLVSTAGAQCSGDKGGAPLGLPPGGQANKHRETQMQLQRKLQERVVIREQKRKLQDQQTAAACKPQQHEKGKGKRARVGHHNGSTNPVASDSSEQKPQGNLVTSSSCEDIVCDTNFTSMVAIRNHRGAASEVESQCEANSKKAMVSPAHKSNSPKKNLENNSSTSDIIDCGDNCLVSAQMNNSSVLQQDGDLLCNLTIQGEGENVCRTSSECTAFKPLQEMMTRTSTACGTTANCQQYSTLTLPADNITPPNKLPIPRLANSSKKQLANVIIFPPVTATTLLQPSTSPHKISKKKYKPIQPKPQEEVKVLTSGEKGHLVKSDGALTNGKVEKSSRNGTGEVSIGCLEKDALDDYLHGGNSQEQEEELMRYFQHQNSSSSNEDTEETCTLKNTVAVVPAETKSDKLSQLRLLLEKNLRPGFKLESEDAFMTNGGESFAPGSQVPPVVSSASASLSLLSQRSQQNNKRPAPLLPSLLSGGHGARRRVSFETSVMEHHQEVVPPSPNTRCRIFSFTPISPGPHSPLGAHQLKGTCGSKPSSANVSPFVSPRNTPVPRSRHNVNQTSASYLVSSAPSRNIHTAAAKVVRSNSVNSSGTNQYLAPRPRALSTTTPIYSALFSGSAAEPSTTFAVPSEMVVPSSCLIQSSPSSRHGQGNLPHMSPVAVSAPHSPLVQYQQTSSMGTCSSDRLGQKHKNFAPSDSLLQVVLNSTKDTEFSTSENMQPLNSSVPTRMHPAPVGIDPLAQEVSQFFPEDGSEQQNLEAVLSGVQYRSQSVPLHRMTSLSSVLVSPLYIGGQQQPTTFNFNTFASSAASSVAPTPVPSEFADFVSVVGDGTSDASNLLLVENGAGDVAETDGLNSDNLNRIFNLLDDAQEEQRCDLSLAELDEAQHQNTHKLLYQHSRSYPNTPLPYRSTSVHDPIVTSFDAGSVEETNITSRSYPSTPILSLPLYAVAEEETPFQGNSSAVDNLTLNALNLRANEVTNSNSFMARRNINNLLEEQSFSVEELATLETLEALEECDSFSQLVQEVSNSTPDTT